MQNAINVLKLEMIDISGCTFLPSKRQLRRSNIRNGSENTSVSTVITPNLEREVENQKIGKNGGGKKLDPSRKIPTPTIQNNRSYKFMTEKNIPTEKPSAFSQDTPDTKKEFTIDCYNCDKQLGISNEVYEAVLMKLYEEIEKMPDSYESKCPSCNSVKTLPSWRWGRYCDTENCNYKLPGPIGWLAPGSCAEDICSMILEKFDDAVRCGKCGMPTDHVFLRQGSNEGGWVCPTNNCKI